MKLLLSAFWCAPETGSESEIGLQTLLAAASHHDVWMLTQAGNVESLRAHLAQAQCRRTVHVVGVELDHRSERPRPTTHHGFHLYHDRWQRKAGQVALSLDRDVHFDVVHHVTTAAYWTRAGVAVLDRPFVWGPVGGGVEAPVGLVPELGVRGVVEDGARLLGQRALARVGAIRALPRRAAVVLVQNAETKQALRWPGTVDILPHATAATVELPSADVGSRRSDVAFAGRLIPWKAGRLAVRVMRHVEHAEARLRVYGEGPERARMERAAQRWGVAHRVVLDGRVPRQQMQRALAASGVLIHPALHDDSPLIVAEALSLGTPVVCLDHGGPRELVRRWPTSPSATVAPTTPERTARQLAAAVDRFLSAPPPVPSVPLAPSLSFSAQLAAAYERAQGSATETERS